MDCDFHHPLTYVIARLAGFDHKEAEIISHSSQQVDDFTHVRLMQLSSQDICSNCDLSEAMRYRFRFCLQFVLECLFPAFSGVRRMAAYSLWLPFHFLPGNGGHREGEEPEGGFIQKFICTPDSYIAREMVSSCIADRDAPYALERLGVSMHTYTDTWSHQGFSGIHHRVNQVHKIRFEPWKKSFSMRKLFRDIRSKLFRSLAPSPLGHSLVLGYPDLPFLKWEYKDYSGKIIKRDNVQEFLKAADAMYRAMLSFRSSTPQEDNQTMIPSPQRGIIERMFRNLNINNGLERHGLWLRALERDLFGIGSVRLRQLRGKQSLSEGISQTFRQAQQVHYKSVLYDILPRYGISIPIRLALDA